jgi:hypothetical protein
MRQDCPTDPPTFTHYVQPSTVTPILMLAALDDKIRHLETDPQDSQAILNGCLASLRTEKIQTMYMNMIGSLTTHGYDLEEAILRALANAVVLGMKIEGRLREGKKAE